MSHEVETMAYSGAVPWHGLGTQVDSDLSPEEMMKAAGLDWTVSKRPLMTSQTPVVRTKDPAEGEVHVSDADYSLAFEEGYALVRDSDNSILGFCGKKYIPLQNQDAFSFFKRFTDAGHMTMETAGSLMKGRHVWGLAKLNKGFELTGGDEIQGYLLLSHPHIWGKAMVIKFTPIRVVCNNTITMALGAGSTNGKKPFRMPHYMAMDAEVIAAAEEALGLGEARLKEFQEKAELLSKKKITDKQLATFIGRIFDAKKYQAMEKQVIAEAKRNITVEELRKLTENIEMGIEEASRTAYDVYQYAKASPGADLKSAKGTLWGALNGVTFAVDHRLGRSTDSRLQRAWFGDRERTKQQALDLAMEMAK